MFAEIDLSTKKVKRIVNGIKPNGFYLPVVDNSIYPTDPDLFKATPNYEYAVNVETWLDEAELKADWSFSDDDYVEQIATQGIKSLDECKEEVYKVLADKRWAMENAGVEIDGLLIPTDRETSIIIAALPDAPVSSFKVSNGVWITSKTTEEVVAVKLAHRTFIQAAFDWEEAETALVIPMDYEQLVIYLTAM